MRLRHPVVLTALILAAPLPAAASAGVRIVAVTPLDGGCFTAPASGASRTWDIQPGAAYRVTIDRLGECDDEDNRRGPVPLMLVNPTTGNTLALVQRQGDGALTFDFTAPAGACDTYRIRGCDVSGYFGGASFGRGPLSTPAPSPAGLRMAGFTAGCAASTPVTCTTPALSRTWGALKTIYR